MKNKKMISSIVVIALLVGMLGMLVQYAQASSPLPNYNNINVKCANIEGISFDPNHIGAYYIQALAASGGGFNAVHISTDPTVGMGQSTISRSQSGVFYATDTGGRGYQDDVILMLAVNGTIPDNFGVHIHASGYGWTPTGVSNDAPALGAITYHSSALDESFDKNDFIYGPQNWKPSGGDANYPIFVSEDMSDPDNAFQIMFIDTHVGMLGTNYPYGGNSQFTDSGAVKVEYTFTNMPTYAAFDIYAWNWATTQGQGMLWTNRILPPAGLSPNGGANNNPVSDYSVIGVPVSTVTPTPTPTPSSIPNQTVSPTASHNQNKTVTVSLSAVATSTAGSDASTTMTPTAIAHGTTTITPANGQAPTPTARSGISSPTSSAQAGQASTPFISYPISLLIFIGTAMVAWNLKMGLKK